MSLNLTENCYEFATGCRNPKRVEEHCSGLYAHGSWLLLAVVKPRDIIRDAQNRISNP